jgi:hypothetical protein
LRFVLVDLETDGAKAFGSEFDEQRQPDVAEPDYTRLGLLVRY